MEVLENEVLCKYGAVERLISDRGSAFTSHRFAAIMDKWRVRHTLATTEHPQTNGLCERANRTLVNVLRCYLDGGQNGWEELLPRVVFAINTAKAQTTQISPFELMFGRSPVLEFDLVFPWPVEKSEKLATFWRRIRSWRLMARRLTRLRQQQSCREVNPRRRPDLNLSPGQLVLVKRRGRRVGKTTKLLPRYTGPYQVVRRVCPTTYLVEDIPARRRRRRWTRFNAHVSQLRLFRTREGAPRKRLDSTPIHIPIEATGSHEGDPPAPDSEVPSAPTDAKPQLPCTDIVDPVAAPLGASHTDRDSTQPDPRSIHGSEEIGGAERLGLAARPKRIIRKPSRYL